jgi:hypothetical protein
MKKSFTRSFTETPRFLKRIWLLRCVLVVFFSTTNLLIFAQASQLETDNGIVASIAPYNADVRDAILKASQYPQILTTLQKNQAQTSASFQNMISNFRQKKQGWFYTLTRYPDLMHALAMLPDGQKEDEIYKLIPTQDEDLKESSWKLYRHEKQDLIQVDNINVNAQEEFNKTIQGLDAPTIAAFQKLSTLPDVLTLLTNNIDLTSRLGIKYLANPMQLNNHLTALHDSLNVQNQYEIATFKKQMDDNPQAMQELSQAAKDYANANGYNIPAQQNYNLNNPNYYGNPYSYWFGYPSWYASPLWYPNSFGYNSGFYMGTGGFGMYGFPSYGFSNWFFNGGYANRYPNLYHQFGNYYHGHVAGNRILGSVNNGFIGVAHNHFNQNQGGRMNYLTSPNGYQRPSGQTFPNSGNTTHTNANTYHSQSWGSFGGRGNAVGGGGRGRH